MPHELLVIDDGPDAETAAVAAAVGVRCLPTGAGHGLNAARNAGLRAAAAPLVAFVDDDVHAPPTWLGELVAGAARHPEAEAFGGPIRARFEGHPPRGCGREDPPITTLDLGPEDREAEMVWGANFAVRRTAVERIGPFEERLRRGHGDEEEWLERLRAAGGTIVYLAHAGLDHRRAPGDARLLPLARAAYRRGRGARASDRRRGRAPSTGHELRDPRRLRLAHRAPRLPAGDRDGRPRRRPRRGDAPPPTRPRPGMTNDEHATSTAAVARGQAAGGEASWTRPAQPHKRGSGCAGHGRAVARPPAPPATFLSGRRGRRDLAAGGS